MVDFQVHIFRLTPLAFPSFQSLNQAARTGTEIAFNEGIKFARRYFLLSPEALIIKQGSFPTGFRLIADSKVLANAVFFSDFSDFRVVFCGEGLIHTVLHHIAERVFGKMKM